MTFKRRELAGLVAAATLFATLGANAAAAADVTVNIGYQPIVEPSRVPQADGTYEKATGAKINWQKFDGGAGRHRGPSHRARSTSVMSAPRRWPPPQAASCRSRRSRSSD